MTLKEIRTDYEELTGKASELNRKLIYSGIAIVWIFHYNIDFSKVQENGIIPNELNLPLRFLCYSFALDLLQYALLGAIWYIYYCCKKDKSRSEESISVHEPELLNFVPWGFWLAKIVCTFIAYYYLASFLRLNI